MKAGPTRKDLEECGILRQIDYDEVARALIDEGKAGWRYDTNKSSIVNLQHFFHRYTLSQPTKPYTLKITCLFVEPPEFHASLVTDISEKTYMAHAASESTAKRAVADRFFEDEDVQNVFHLIPPKPSDVRAKSILHTFEKWSCRNRGASPEVMHEICQNRVDQIYAVFRKWGYRTDLWDALDGQSRSCHA